MGLFSSGSMTTLDRERKNSIGDAVLASTKFVGAPFGNKLRSRLCKSFLCHNAIQLDLANFELALELFEGVFILFHSVSWSSPSYATILFFNVILKIDMF